MTTAAQTRRTDIAQRLQTVLTANRALSPSSRNAILDAIGELSPILPEAAHGLASTSIQPPVQHAE